MVTLYVCHMSVCMSSFWKLEEVGKVCEPCKVFYTTQPQIFLKTSELLLVSLWNSQIFYCYFQVTLEADFWKSIWAVDPIQFITNNACN